MTASARGWWWGKINIHILYFSFSRSALASLTNVFGKNEKKNKTSVYRLRHPRTSSYENAVWTYNKGTPRCTGKGFRRRWWLCSLTVTEVVTYHIDNICKGLSQIQFLSNPLCFGETYCIFASVKFEKNFSNILCKRPTHHAWHVTQWNLRSIVWDESRI